MPPSTTEDQIQKAKSSWREARQFAVANVGSNLMKAVLLDKPGPPSSLRIGEISIPRPGVDEALVRVCATSLNPVDYKVAAQGYEGWNYSHVLGVDVAGVIETMEKASSHGIA